MLITEEYRQKNIALHAEKLANFGGKAEKRFDAVKGFLEEYKCRTVLDYGCGKGGLVRALRKDGIEARGYDPCFEPYMAEPRPAEFVVCYEGPEHWEEECVDDVLAHVASLTNKAAWVVTALRESGDKFADGSNAHVCIHDGDWWLEKFRQHFPVVKIRLHREPKVLDVICLK